jgi:hypothetical protein
MRGACTSQPRCRRGLTAITRRRESQGGRHRGNRDQRHHDCNQGAPAEGRERRRFVPADSVGKTIGLIAALFWLGAPLPGGLAVVLINAAGVRLSAVRMKADDAVAPVVRVDRHQLLVSAACRPRRRCALHTFA